MKSIAKRFLFLTCTLTCLFLGVGILYAADTQPAEPIGIEVKGPVNVAYHIKVTDTDNGKSSGMHELLHLIQVYDEQGIGADQRDIHAVFDGPAYVFVLKPTAGVVNPGNAGLVKELLAHGVHIEVCNQRLGRANVADDQLLPGVEPVVSGQARVIDLQLRDYAYFRF